MVRSPGRPWISGRKRSAKDRASAHVMCIFQLPAITAGRDAVATDPVQEPANLVPRGRLGKLHLMGATVEAEAVAIAELPTPAQLCRTIDHHLA